MAIFHKVAATVLAFTILDTTEGMQSSITDTSVAALTIFAYVVCRGWESWRAIKRADPPARLRATRPRSPARDVPSLSRDLSRKPGRRAS